MHGETTGDDRDGVRNGLRAVKDNRRCRAQAYLWLGIFYYLWLFEGVAGLLSVHFMRNLGRDYFELFELLIRKF